MNAIKGNVYIIDSSALYLTSNSTSTGTFTNMSISAIVLYGSGSTSELGLSFASANSTDFVHLKVGDAVGGNGSLSFTSPLKTSEAIYVRTLVAGTGYIYFS